MMGIEHIPKNQRNCPPRCYPGAYPFVECLQCGEKDQEIVCLIAEVERLQKETTRLTAENETLLAILNKRNRFIFGRSSEKSPPPATTESSEEEACLPYPKKRGGRCGHKGHGRTIPDLQEDVKVHKIPEDMRYCAICGKPVVDIALTEESYEIDYEIRFFRVKHIRKRAVHTCHCPGHKIVTAPKPNQAIPKGKFSHGFLAHVLTSKHLYQIPLHRQIIMMRMQGLSVCEGTLTGAFNTLLLLLEPLYFLLVEVSRQAHHWLVDETGWLNAVQIPGKKGYRWWLWVFVSELVVVFVLDPSRSSNVPFQHFGTEAEGIINTDRYSSYSKLIRLAKGLIRALCWAHFRRDFTEAGNALAVLKQWADEWIQMIACIYHLNNVRLAVVGDPVAYARAHAEVESAIEEMAQRRDEELKDPTLHWQKHKILISAQKNWPGLTVFVEHHEIPMDNNEAERALRLAALGRKNYYGTHSLWSAQLAAVCMSILQTAARHGLNPEAYLHYYLDSCAQHNGPPPDLEQFLPWNIQKDILEHYSLREKSP